MILACHFHSWRFLSCCSDETCYPDEVQLLCGMLHGNAPAVHCCSNLCLRQSPYFLVVQVFVLNSMVTPSLTTSTLIERKKRASALRHLTLICSWLWLSTFLVLQSFYVGIELVDGILWTLHQCVCVFFSFGLPQLATRLKNAFSYKINPVSII